MSLTKAETIIRDRLADQLSNLVAQLMAENADLRRRNLEEENKALKEEVAGQRAAIICLQSKLYSAIDFIEELGFRCTTTAINCRRIDAEVQTYLEPASE